MTLDQKKKITLDIWITLDQKFSYSNLNCFKKAQKWSNVNNEKKKGSYKCGPIQNENAIEF